MVKLYYVTIGIIVQRKPKQYHGKDILLYLMQEKYLYEPSACTTLKACDSSDDEPKRNGWIVSSSSPTQPNHEVEQNNEKKVRYKRLTTGLQYTPADVRFS